MEYSKDYLRMQKLAGLITENEENAIELKAVGRDTGVKLNMRKVISILKDNGYHYIITDGNMFTGIKAVTTYGKYGEGKSGHLTFTKNGEVFGSDLWGTEITSENEVIPTIEQFYQDQENI
jgi:hypothetical protein